MSTAAQPSGAPAGQGGWTSHRGLLTLAVGYQWFYNGANFLAFKVAGDALHPLMVAALRFSTAGLLLLPFAVARRKRGPTSARIFVHAALLGIVMLVLGQALSIWGTHFLPAGVASVFGSAPPLFLAIFAWTVFGQALARRQVAGVLVGFAGLALMGWTSATAGGFHPIGAALTLAASAAWAMGSLLATRLALSEDPVVSLTTQLIAAGLALWAVVLTTGIAGEARLHDVSPAAWAALAFLVIASTLIGYAVFLALNAGVSSTLANTFNYAAPVVALGLAALLLHEQLTVTKVLASAVTLSGVALMIGGKSGDDRANSAANAAKRKRA